MKIEKIQINGFGKLENKDIELTNGINIIIGKNESGKSTLLKFINSMLYGISNFPKPFICIFSIFNFFLLCVFERI